MEVVVSSYLCRTVVDKDIDKGGKSGGAWRGHVMHTALGTSDGGCWPGGDTHRVSTYANDYTHYLAFLK